MQLVLGGFEDFVKALEVAHPGGEGTDERVRAANAAHTRLAYSRPVCEAIGAATAALITFRRFPGMTIADGHLRLLRAVPIGAVVGHGVGRVAVRGEEAKPREVEATRAA